jgi:molecular chaperone IbpA
MNSIDLTPFYKSSIGFDGLESLIDSALNADTISTAYPHYNIAIIEKDQYCIDLAVAGFDQSELSIEVENGVLTVSGKKASRADHQYVYQGIAHRDFERKFNLADYVEVKDAKLNNGLLSIELVREVPEAMKPKNIAINQSNNVIEHQTKKSKNQDDSKAA